jgi:nicotinamide-nucleotide amidase
MTEKSVLELPRDVEETVERALAAACEKELRLSTAESCTGGLLASILTDMEGCSHAFERGFVVYTDEAKREMLGVDASLLAKNGAVSKECAVAMAEGAIARSSAHIALAVTGFAGPAHDGNEEGLVHLACARRGNETLHREAHYGAIGRGPVRIACLRDALDMLEEALR